MAFLMTNLFAAFRHNEGQLFSLPFSIAWTYTLRFTQSENGSVSRRPQLLVYLSRSVRPLEEFFSAWRS
jgi:hypothetical protein